MKGILFKLTCFWILFFFTTRARAQDEFIPVDSAGFYDFLILQQEVPNLSMLFSFEGVDFFDSLRKSVQFPLASTDSSFVAGPFNDLKLAKESAQILSDYGIAYDIHYLVFSDISSYSATREYLSNLIKSGDFLIQTEETIASEDIVSLASYAHYAPLQKFKLRFITDYKLLIVTVIIVFFFLVAFGMIAFMLVMKARKTKKEYLLKEYDRLIVDPLTSLLFEKELQEIIDLDQVTINDYFPASMLSKPIFKEVLIERIIGLNKKMKGDFKEKLKALYRKLELDKISINSLKSQRWDRVAMGLVQINEMDLSEGLIQVKDLTNSSNFQIRSQAVATILNLSEKVDLTFLRDQTYPLSLWQQMNYLRIIRFVSHQKKLKLEVLFESKNPSIRIFGYKLVKTLGRVDLIEVIASKAAEVSDEEKIEILEIYAALGAHMEVDFVNQCLTSENPSLVLSASKTASIIGNAESAILLTQLINSESNYRRKQSLMKNLYDLDKDAFEQVSSAADDLELDAIKRHILDPMLQNV